jgi:hypothetical protein
MQEGNIRQDVETWLRYLTSKFNKQLLDISALQRLIYIIVTNPEFKELIAALLLRNLETENEISAIMMLHVINTIVYNLRLSSRDNTDADFLGKVLDLGLDIMEKNLKKNWKDWPNQLGRTLMEWKNNYKIENRLTKDLQKLLESKEKEELKLRDIHYTCVECIDDLFNYLRDNNTESISIHLLRVFENSFNISDPLVEPYNKILYSDTSNEGWNNICKITNKYLVSMISSPNTINLVFRSTNLDKLGLIPQMFAVMHAGTFIESSVGASIRALINLLKTMDTKAALSSPGFQRCMNEIISFFKYTVENMHSLSPFLCKYLCEICEIINKIKAQQDFWNEINGLLVLRLLAPAVSNPVLAGIVEFADMNAVQLLTYTAKIIQHAWVGKVIEHGDLSTQTWINDLIPQWKNELQNSFYSMLNSRKYEPKVISLPKTLLIYDLLALDSKIKGFSWNKCPGIATIAVIKRPETVNHTEEIEEDIKIEEEPVQITKKVIKHDEIEDSTPSMQSLPPVNELYSNKNQIIHTAPPDAFKSLKIEIIHEEPLNPFKEAELADPVPEKPKTGREVIQRSRAVQCASLSFASQYIQTEVFQNTSKLVQTDSENYASKIIQTDPEKQRMKIRSRLENTIQIMDQETITDLNLNEIYDEYTSFKSKLEDLELYKQQETTRISKVNHSWANQFREIKNENSALKARVKILEEEIKDLKSKEIGAPLLLSKTFSHNRLREELVNKYFVKDENFLKKCDPNYYLGLENENLSLRSSMEHVVFKDDYDGRIHDVLKTFAEFKEME